MARYVDVHPVNPQERLLRQVVEVVRDGGVIAYPTDSGYALGCAVGNVEGRDRIATIRQLGKEHAFALMCSDFAQLGQLVQLSNRVFRAVKASTPGPYTFVLPGTSEVPKRLLEPKRRSIGVRISPNVLVQALLAELGEPLLSTSLILPGEELPMVDGWLVKDELDAQIDAVVDSGECGSEPTTVVDLTGDEPVIIRYGAGDASRFEA